MGLFDFVKKIIPSLQNEQEALFDSIVEKAQQEEKNNYHAKASDLESYKLLTDLSDKQKVHFVLHGAKVLDTYHANRNSYSSTDTRWQFSNTYYGFINHLMKTKIALDEEDIVNITEAFLKNRMYNQENIFHWPVGNFIQRLETHFKEASLTENKKQALLRLRKRLEETENYYYEKNRVKLIEKIDKIFFAHEHGEQVIKPVYFPGEDDFAVYANGVMEKFNDPEKIHWFKLLSLSQKASGGRPSPKFLNEAKAVFSELGADKFKKIINDWILWTISFEEKEITHVHTYNNREYTHTSVEFLSAPNVEMIKGLIWMCTHFHDKTTLHNIASLAERSYRKIPGKGPAAAAIGNACLYVLANSKGLDGVGHLSRLKLRIKQSSTQALIDKYLNEAAKKEGVTVHEIEDMAVDDHGLSFGKREFEFENYKATLEITGVGKTELNWFKPDGSPQKSVPSFIKEKHAAKFKKIKELLKQIDLTTSAQRDRIDRMLKANRQLSWSKFNEFYLSHGLMHFLVKNIIWVIEFNGNKLSAFYLNGKWVDQNFEEINVDPGSSVSLWHPVFYSVDEISRWREFMETNKIVQPLKQAFREVYLLTDAEINTRTYSNRMAAHILKQHQFNSLAKTRGWKYSLLGAYDDGRSNEMAQLILPEYNLKAEYWVNEVNADDAFNDTGIWLYVSTDQVRFVKLDNNEVIELLEVPRLVLSEVMRDVDLFVGVASVGNDPAWSDSGGLPAYRDYWHSYSFGDLTELAKTRKTILDRLLPRLKIANVAQIRDKFLIVKGKLRTYKIHIGSTNILMEPNDQYLCIVPDRSQKPVTTEMFLPFEGDNGLSIILSKAMLLANDDKITDETITRQIKIRQ
jgi:hypothetical protein